MKLFLMSAAVTALLFLNSCVVNEHWGEIKVINYTTTDCKNLKVGDIYIGFVPRGSVRSVYFFKDHVSAPISSDNFDAEYSVVFGKGYYEGEIDLKKNYIYTMELDILLDRNDERHYYIKEFQGDLMNSDESSRVENENREIRY